MKELQSTTFKSIGSRLLEFIYPSSCIVCSEECFSGGYLCNNCAETIEFNEIWSRCPRCFSNYACFDHSQSLEKTAFAFDRQLGVMGAIKERFQKIGGNFLDEVLGAYLFIFFNEVLQWEEPDCVLSLPLKGLKQVLSQYDPHYLLAKVFSRYINRPYYSAYSKRGLASLLKFSQRLKGQSIVLIASEAPYEQYLEYSKELKRLGAKSIKVLGLVDPEPKLNELDVLLHR